MLLINKTELARTLTVLSKVAPKGVTLPVLKCARLQTIDRQTVSLTATNLEEFFTCRMSVYDAPEGLDALLPIPEVRNFTKGNSRALLQLEPIATGGISIAEITGGKLAKQEFPALEAKDFPAMPPCPEQMFDMPTDFIQTLREVVPSISLADTRAVLHGILLCQDGIVTTNGKELCCVPHDLPVKDNCILRIPNCLFTAEFLGMASKFGTVQSDPNTWTTIRVADWTLTSKCISGNYPSWRQAVPQDEILSFSMTLDKSNIEKFTEALKQLPETPPLHSLQLKTDEDKLEVFADCTPVQKVECTLSEAKGQLPEQGMFISRKLLLRALALGHNIFACNPEIPSVIVATGGLGKFVFMPIKYAAQANNNVPQPNEPQNNQMEKDPMNNNTNVPEAGKTETTEQKTTITPVSQNGGFKIVAATDPYEELLENAEELRTSIRNMNEQMSNLVRKIRDYQASSKRREKDMKAAREAIEKLKVSGF